MELNEKDVLALQEFKDKKTFKLTDKERLREMEILLEKLSNNYGIKTPTLGTANMDGRPSDTSFYSPSLHYIEIHGYLSIITLLHEFAHSIKLGQNDAVEWSISLFKTVYPRQFEKLNFNGRVARKV